MEVQLKATNQKTKAGKASVPTEILSNDVFKNTGYIRIKTKSRSTALEVEERFGATGIQVWIKPKTLGLTENQYSDATIESVSVTGFRVIRLFKTKAGLLALLAFLAALIGTSIKLSFVIGAAGSAVWTVSPLTKSILIWASSGLEITGLIVLFVRSAWLGIK